MPPLRILICGGGIAGPALAFWLAQANQGHTVVIVERFPNLRAAGAQIDLRAQGIDVIKLMGLEPTIRSKLVDEKGVAMVDTNGKIWATVLANTSGKGAQSLTSEYEIMRGDLVQILYDATKNSTEYRFSTTIESFEQDDEGVTAHFSNDKSERFDLLVGADGQGSRVRSAIFPADANGDPYFRLGMNMAYWTQPREPQDDNFKRSYMTTGKRWIQRRTHNESDTQVYFTVVDEHRKMQSVARASVDEQKQWWAAKFADAGWQTDRFLKGIKLTSNFYCQEVVQVKLSQWYKGHVVLLGDAGYCPSPLSGMGTTAGLVGAYVLAGEIARHCDNPVQACVEYDKTLRPFVDTIQGVPVKLLKRALPETQWGCDLMLTIASWVCWLGVPQLISRFKGEKTASWQLPQYSLRLQQQP